MEQVVILILFVVGSIVSSILQNKKKREAEAEARGEGDKLPPFGGPLEQWPDRPPVWMEELRRLFDPQKAPPVVPPAAKAPPVLIPPARVARKPAPIVEKSEGDQQYASPFKSSDAAMAHASGLHERVRARMRSIDDAMHGPKPAVVPARAAAPITRWNRHPNALREAFIASLIFSPPVSER